LFIYPFGFFFALADFPLVFWLFGQARLAL
jgi:hypothetical protein